MSAEGRRLPIRSLAEGRALSRSTVEKYLPSNKSGVPEGQC